jgi:hypothetical protein
MADERSYTLNWSEIVDKTGRGTVDMDEVRLWLAGGDPENEVAATHEPTAEEVKDFLESGDISEVILNLDDWEALNTDLHEVDSVVLG